MKRVAYVGDPDEINPKTELGAGPEVITYYGQDFVKGEYTMPASDHIFKKASNNRTFVVEDKRKPADKPAE